VQAQWNVVDRDAVRDQAAGRAEDRPGFQDFDDFRNASWRHASVRPEPLRQPAQRGENQPRLLGDVAGGRSVEGTLAALNPTTTRELAAPRNPRSSSAAGPLERPERVEVGFAGPFENWCSGARAIVPQRPRRRRDRPTSRKVQSPPGLVRTTRPGEVVTSPSFKRARRRIIASTSGRGAPPGDVPRLVDVVARRLPQEHADVPRFTPNFPRAKSSVERHHLMQPSRWTRSISPGLEHHVHPVAFRNPGKRSVVRILDY